MMKLRVLLLIVFVRLCGCQSSTTCNIVIGSGWVQGRIAFWQDDALHGLYNDLDTSVFDVGVSLDRETYADGTRAIFPRAEMAFEQSPSKSRNGTPASVAHATVNSLELNWQDCNSQNGADIYFRRDTLLYGKSDSVTYSYSGFNGDSFTSAADIAKPFGRFYIDHGSDISDSVSISKGFTLHYTNVVPGDSILVAINALDTTSVPYYVVPDTGTIVFRPNFIAYNSRMAEVHIFVIDFIRVHLCKQTSTAGKRIAVYSTFGANCDFDVKP
jgi:hypothetical protein